MNNEKVCISINAPNDPAGQPTIRSYYGEQLLPLNGSRSWGEDDIEDLLGPENYSLYLDGDSQFIVDRTAVIIAK